MIDFPNSIKSISQVMRSLPSTAATPTMQPTGPYSCLNSYCNTRSCIITGRMDWLGGNWGNVISTLGLAATIIGLFIVFHRAREAQKSADASRMAAQETQQAFTSVLTIVDLERAIAMVQRLKQLHIDQKWEASLELYQPLRVMLTNINTRGTIDTPAIREAIPQISVIEENIGRAIARNAEPTGSRNFVGTLNNIQMDLEQLASSTHIPGHEGRSDNG